jgi:biotin carboxyl carrier protein
MAGEFSNEKNSVLQFCNTPKSPGQECPHRHNHVFPENAAPEMRLPPLLLASILAALATPAAANDGLKRCRALGEAAARLACYDALPLEAATPAPAPGPQARNPPSSQAQQQPAPAGRPAGSPAAPPPKQADLEASFGMEGRAPSAELAAVESYIPGTFYGWSQGSQIKLANGQVWQVVDEGGRRMQLQDPKVRVRRGMMSAFYLEFEAHNYAPRVRRVQ